MQSVCWRNGQVCIEKCDPMSNGRTTGKSNPAVVFVSSTEPATNSTRPPNIPVTTAEAVAVGVNPMSNPAKASCRSNGINTAQAIRPMLQFATSR